MSPANTGIRVVAACRPQPTPPNHATGLPADRASTRNTRATPSLLGHTKADVTQIYAERDMSRAATVAAKIG